MKEIKNTWKRMIAVAPELERMIVFIPELEQTLYLVVVGGRYLVRPSIDGNGHICSASEVSGTSNHICREMGRVKGERLLNSYQPERQTIHGPAQRMGNIPASIASEIHL
jgi:hypothetical protein